MKIDNVNALDDLLGGKTFEADEPVTEEDKEPKPLEEGSGGDQDLDSSGTEDTTADNDDAEETAKKDDGAAQKQAAAFARMRVENTNMNKTINALAQALGIDASDPEQKYQKLLEMAHTKLAQKAELPVEVFNKLNKTEEELNILRQEQQIRTARENFYGVQKRYGLSDTEMEKFGRQLDEAGITPTSHPNADLEYEYYRLNHDTIIKQREQAAREDALKNKQAAAKSSTKPSGTKGAGDDDDQKKINSVSALEDFLNDNK